MLSLSDLRLTSDRSTIESLTSQRATASSITYYDEEIIVFKDDRSNLTKLTCYSQHIKDKVGNR